MAGVGAVFRYLLQMAAHRVLRATHVRPRLVGNGRQRRNGPIRRVAVRVEPNKHETVRLDGRPFFQPNARGTCTAI